MQVIVGSRAPERASRVADCDGATASPALGAAEPLATGESSASQNALAKARRGNAIDGVEAVLRGGGVAQYPGLPNLGRWNRGAVGDRRRERARRPHPRPPVAVLQSGRGRTHAIAYRDSPRLPSHALTTSTGDVD